jgi:hypothetical protein
MTSRNVLFLAGQGRSGTTALLHVLASHPEVALGVERFKALWGEADIDRLKPDLFDRDRFFDFSDGLTNLTPESFDREWETHYERMAAKWDTATYVGDKMTQVRMQRLWETIPDARFVCIVREIAQVAHSWNQRARDSDDLGWPEAADAQLAVKRWNAMLGKIRRARTQRPEQVVVVTHSRFFGDPSASSLHAVLDFLGLDHAPEVESAFAEAHDDYATRIAGKPRVLSPADRAFIDEHADRRLWKQVTALAV